MWTKACKLSNKEEFQYFRVQRNEDYRSREHLVQSEIDDLLEAAQCYGTNKSDKTHRDYTLILLMLRHGLRAVEAAKLTWQQIDLRGKTIYIKRAKGSKSGTHILENDELEALTILKESQSEGTKELFGLQSRGVSRVIERVAKKAGLEIKAHAHMLRHTCGYLLINNGWNCRQVQDYLGHRNFDMTERYTAIATNQFPKVDWNNLKG